MHVNVCEFCFQDGKSGRTPLFYAVEGNQLALVMLFRQCNANLDLTNYAGISALMAAQAKGFSEASSVLMVGLDPKAIIEHKEKEKMMMPNKKVRNTEAITSILFRVQTELSGMSLDRAE